MLISDFNSGNLKGNIINHRLKKVYIWFAIFKKMIFKNLNYWLYRELMDLGDWVKDLFTRKLNFLKKRYLEKYSTIQ